MHELDSLFAIKVFDTGFQCLSPLSSSDTYETKHVYDSCMIEPMTLAGLATNLVMLILRVSDHPTAADLTGDARNGLALLSKLRRSNTTNYELITQTITNNLSKATNTLYDHYRRQGIGSQALSAAITEVEIFLKEIAPDDSLSILSVRSENEFRDELHKRSAARRANIEQILEPYFNALIDSVVDEYLKLAPHSRQFQYAYFKSTFASIEAIESNTNDTLSVVKALKDGQESILDILGKNAHVLNDRPIFSGNRPFIGAHYIDRVEQDTLHQYVLQDGRPRTVLIGMRGSGKSQLASSLARLCETQKWKLVVWIDASSVNSLRSGLAELASRLGINSDGSTTQDQLILQCLNQMRSSTQSDRLIILDNVINIKHLTNLVPEGDGLRIVATTNSYTGWKHQSWNVIEIGMFSSQEALDYLLTATNSLDHETGATICDLLGNLPLAIAQAASTASAEDWTLKQYLARLRARKAIHMMNPVPGDSYKDKVATALLLATESTLTNLTEAQEQTARKQLNILALLAQTGVPRRWLDPLANEDADELIFDAKSESAHHAMSALINASVIQRSTDKRTVMLHRLQSQVIRDHWSETDIYDARRAAVQTLADIKINALPEDDTTNRAHETSALINQLRAITAQEYSRDMYKFEALVTCLEHTLMHAREQGLRLETLTLADSIDYIQSISGTTDRKILSFRTILANAFRRTGQLARATLLFEQLRDQCREIYGAKAPETLDLENDVANAYREAGRIADAIVIYEYTLETSTSELGNDAPLTQLSRNNLAVAYREQGRTSDAIRLAESNLTMRLKLYGEKARQTLFSQHVLATCYMSAGRFLEAVKLYDSCLKGRLKTFGPTHPRTLSTQTAKARGLLELGRHKEAIQLFEKTLRQRLERQGPTYPGTLFTQNHLGRAYLANLEVDKARELFEYTLVQNRNIQGSTHPRTLNVQDGLARTYLALGRHKDAIIMHKRTVIGYLDILGPSHPDTLAAQDGLARAYFAMGQHSMATELHHIVFSQRRSVLGAHHPYTVTSYNEFRKAYRLTNTPQE